VNGAFPNTFTFSDREFSGNAGDPNGYYGDPNAHYGDPNAYYGAPYQGGPYPGRSADPNVRDATGGTCTDGCGG
jgi:hypothetical protein